MVLTVIQPVNHGRVLGHSQQDLSVFTHTLLSEQVDHGRKLVVVVDLGNPRREQLMPEEGHFLFQRTLGGNHTVHPLTSAMTGHRPRLPGPWVVPQKTEFIERLILVQVQ